MTRDEIVLDFFINHSDYFIKDIAFELGLSRSTVQRTLKKYENWILPNGNTIKEQLQINKIKGTINGGIQSSKMNLYIKDDEGKFLGSIRVSNDFDRKILNEARYYLNHDVKMKDVAVKFDISIRTLYIHFKKLESIDLETFKLVKQKSALNQQIGRRNTSGGRVSTYTQEDINKICDIILNNCFSYNEASEFFNIPSSTLFELMQRVDEERRIKLNLLAEANIRNTLPENIIGNRRI